MTILEKSMSIEIKAKAREVREIGYTILPGYLPRTLMEACNNAFAVIGCQRAWLQRNVAPDETPIPRAQWNGLAEDERKRLRTFEYLVTD